MRGPREISGKFSRFCLRLPIVCAAEECCGEIFLRFGGSELVGPGGSGGGVCAWTGGVRFGVVGGLFVGGIVPVIPAGRVEVGGELGVDVDDAGVGTPGAAEGGGAVGGGRALCSGGGGVHGWGGVVDAAG